MKKSTFLPIFISLLLISSCGPVKTEPSNSSSSVPSSEVSSTSSSESLSSEKTSSESSSSKEESSSESSSQISSESSSESSSQISSESSSQSSSEQSSSSSEDSSSDIPSSEVTSSSSSPEVSSPEEPEPIYLDIPEVNLDEETGLAYWASVENALSYNVIINNGEIENITNLSYPLNDYSNISVQAVNGIYKSEWSKAITNYSLVETVYVEDNDIKVFFHDSDIETQTLSAGQTVTKPNDPTKEHFIFDGFYKDAYFKTLFNFDEKIFTDTIIYTKWVKNDYIDTEFWIKADPKITSSIMSINSSESGWKFIPLTRSIESDKVVYKAIVEVTDSSSANPAGFLVMDGFEDGGLRNYYKSGIFENGKELDFLIKEDATYLITFSLDSLYGSSSNPCHAKFEKYTNSKINYSDNFELATPVVTVDSENNLASWLEVAGATSYEVVINNGEIISTTDLSISLNKKQHISVRAVAIGVSSKWSIPAGNVETLYRPKPESEQGKVSYYFSNSGVPSKVVAKDTIVDNAPEISKEGYTFDGWYTNVARTTKAIFPYKISRNTIFYPKFINNSVTSEEVFYIADGNGERIIGLTLNEDNYEFLEYQSEAFSITSNKDIYVMTSKDSDIKYGPYNVSTGKYVLYFSEDYLWDIDTEKERNIYLSSIETVFYFSNNYHWNKVYSYHWGSSILHSWPGHEMTYVTTNEYNEKIYKVSIDIETYPNGIFNNGSGAQTKDLDLSIYPSGTGFYISGGSDNSLNVGTYTYQG